MSYAPIMRIKQNLHVHSTSQTVLFINPQNMSIVKVTLYVGACLALFCLAAIGRRGLMFTMFTILYMLLFIDMIPLSHRRNGRWSHVDCCCCCCCCITSLRQTVLYDSQTRPGHAAIVAVQPRHHHAHISQTSWAWLTPCAFDFDTFWPRWEH